MNIAVVGTGANGAGIGADLTKAGLDVTFIEQWPSHVEAMRRDGVRVQTPLGTEVTQVHAIHLCEVATLRRKFDLVFVVVKAYDTRWACELIKPLLSDTGLAVGLQNGMTLDDMADVLGDARVLGSVIEVTSNMFEPGVVNRQTPTADSWFALGSFHPSTRGREAEVAPILGHAGRVEIVSDIRSAKWMKLVANASELVPSAILNLPLMDAVAIPEMHQFMLEAGKETARTAVALGHHMVPIFGKTASQVTEPEQYAVDLLDSVLTDFCLPDTKTTVLQDWLKGRRAEVEEVNGLVVRKQQKLGGRALANEIVVDVAREIESGQRLADPGNMQTLLDRFAESSVPSASVDQV